MSEEREDVWLLLDSSKPGGIETHVLQLAVGLHRRGTTVRVVLLKAHAPDHPLLRALTRAGVNHSVLDGTLGHLFAELRSRRPRVLHTHGYKAGLEGRLCASCLGIPTVSTYHAGEVGRGKLRLYDWLDRQLAPMATEVISVSDAIADRVRGPVQVLDNFVDLPPMPGEPGDEIAFVGRLSMEKGPDYILDMAEQAPDLTFHLYGDGPLRGDLEARALPNVIFHGLQPDMTAIWPRIDVLLMPSRFEGLPMAALEAMGRGIPVLAFDAGAMRSVLADGGGRVIESPCAAKLLLALREWQTLASGSRLAVREAARRTVSVRYSADAQLPKVMDVYRRCLGGSLADCSR